MRLAGWGLAELGVLFAAGALAITGLYLLRMRRRKVVVPFAALWDRVTRESESRRLWKRLRRLVSWLIQILLLALVCLALGDPRPESWFRDPRTLAIVVDHSASMAGASESGRTRLQDGLDRARQELRALGPVDRALVIAAGAEVGIAVPLGSEPDTHLAALETLAPVPGESDLTQALSLARHAVSDQEGGEILVITDGALDPAGSQALLRCADGELPCRVAMHGGPTDNVSITAFAARRYPHDREHVEALVEVRNLGESAVEVVLEVEADGVSVGRRSLNLEAGGRTREVLPDLDAARPRLLARLTSGNPAILGPAFDDVAHAVVPPLRPYEVAIVSDGSDLFLDAALLTQAEHVRLSAVSPEAARTDPSAFDGIDLVFFDVANDTLPDALPAAHAVFFDPWRTGESPCPIPMGREVRRPFLTELDRRHPVMDHVVLKDVNLGRGTTFASEPGDEVLVRTLGEPIVVLRQGTHGVMAIGFDPRQSDFPLRVAFPLFVGNIVAYFEQQEPGFVATVPVGRSRELGLAELGLAAEGVTRIEVAPPEGAGDPVQLPVTDGRFRLRALQTGIHRIRALDGDTPDATVELAVNQASEFASNLGDRVGDRLPAAAQAGPAPEPTPVGDGPLWTLLLVGAAIVLVTEWTTYHRRMTV